MQAEQGADETMEIGQAAARIDRQRNIRRGGRKRVAVKEESDEAPAAQRVKIDKSIAGSLNAGTSKPGLREGINNDKGYLDGQDGDVKREHGQFEDDIEWFQIGDDGNELGGLTSGDDED